MSTGFANGQADLCERRVYQDQTNDSLLVNSCGGWERQGRDWANIALTFSSRLHSSSSIFKPPSLPAAILTGATLVLLMRDDPLAAAVGASGTGRGVGLLTAAEAALICS